jgi:chromosome segregation protein
MPQAEPGGKRGGGPGFDGARPDSDPRPPALRRLAREGRDPVLSLREIEIFGFKSFAERTRLPLPGDIIAVVGPNGSGKSNVADAVLWALGEQSAKSLRGQKMQDVIFQGSHRRPAAGAAEVFLNFAEDDGTRVRVGRRLLRSGESAYLMDGRSVRLKDIHDYLQRNGVSTQGTFLVEQGRVEGLLAASPEERRMILEEVAGIAHYKENRKSALQKLDATEANLTRLQDIISEVETQKVSLKKQAAKADRFVKLSDELRERKRSFLGRSYRLVAGRRTALARDLEMLRQEVHRRGALMAQADSGAEAAKTAVSDHEARIVDLVKGLHARELELERLNGENKRRLEQILSGQGRLRQISADRADLERRIAASAKECERLDLERAALDEEKGRAGREEEEARGALAEARRRLEEADRELKTARDEVFRLAQEAALAGASLQRSEGDLTRQEERLKRMRREEEDLATKEREARETLEDRRATLLRAQQARVDGEAALAGAEAAHAQVQAEVEKAQGAAAAAEKAHATAAARLDALRKQAASLRSSADAHLQTAAPGRLTPTLASLLAGAPSELLPALSSAYGPLLEAHTGTEWGGLPEILGEMARARAGVGVFALSGFAAPDLPPPPGAGGAPGFRGWLAALSGVGEDPSRMLPRVALVETPDQAKGFAERFGIAAVSLCGLFVDRGGVVRGGAGGTGGSALLEYERDLRAGEREVKATQKTAAAAIGTLEETRGRLTEARAVRDRAAEAVESLKGEERARALETRDAEQLASRIATSRDLMAGETAQAEEDRAQIEAEGARLREELKRIQEGSASAQDRLQALDRALSDGKALQDTAHEGLNRAGSRLAEVTQQAESKAAEEKRAVATRRDLEATLGRQVKEAEDIEGRNATLSAEVTACDRELQRLILAFEEDRGLRSRYEDDLKTLQAAAAEAERLARESRESLSEVRTDAVGMEKDLDIAEVEHRNLVERIAELGEETPDSLAEAFAQEPPIADEEREPIQQALHKLEGRIQEIGAVNMLAREEYQEMDQRHNFLLEQKKDLDGAIASLQETIRKINRTTRERFMEAFVSVQEHFAHLFKEVFDGGEARLSLLDDQNPLESGVEIFAQPPGKKLTVLNLLSGGEKAKVALALLFALFKYRPHPFFILDEADAPLDEANINRFNRLLVQFRGQTQFLVISHNKRTMELADALYGVTMVEGGVSRVVSVRFQQAEALGNAPEEP